MSKVTDALADISRIDAIESSVPVINNTLTSTSTTEALSANMGKTLEDSKQATLTFDATPTDGSTNPVTSNGVFDALATKQATLVSGTNIKTVNSTSILGSGDIVIGGGGIGEFIGVNIAVSSDNSALGSTSDIDDNMIAIGVDALGNTLTSENTIAIGKAACQNVTGGDGNNIGIGRWAIQGNGTTDVSGGGNVAIGDRPLRYASSCTGNIALGIEAMSGNSSSTVTGSYNFAAGQQAGVSLTTGQYNFLGGYQAGYNLTSASSTICIGNQAGKAHQAGNGNIFIGQDTGLLSNVFNGGTGASVLVGSYSGTSMNGGYANTILGTNTATTLTTGSNVTVIGGSTEPSSATVSNEVTLGNLSIATLRCQATTITAISDRRDKDNIIELDAGLDFINSLNPVRFDWNMRDGGKVGVNDIGFIAQELQQAQIDNGITVPHLVMDNNPDKLEAGYGMLIAPLVKALQELSAKVDSLESELNTLNGL